ncbi:DUF2321 domain-containing protein [Paenibacillus ehimensis]|uniref:DUF2321 domain-containing protein n=1 Tax=Paenibacillus ehimensis TaxID=79264 RepID=UPI000FDB9E7D|nr:DUF2321 domain-containing protein [Paenibacillus ehimensis]
MDRGYWDNYWLGSGHLTPSNEYDIAEICLNGHVSNDSTKVNPSECKPFCDECGEKTITKCQNCSNDIRGYKINTNYNYSYKAPAYCINCGLPFPWIAKKLEAALELADLTDDFDDKDKEILSKNLNDLVRDTPRTQVAAIQFKKLVYRLEPHFIEGFKSILYNVLSDPVNKMIW